MNVDDSALRTGPGYNPGPDLIYRPMLITLPPLGPGVASVSVTVTVTVTKQGAQSKELTVQMTEGTTAINIAPLLE